MRKEFPLLMLALAVTAKASAQDIVIEPTNGRAQATNHVSRPAPVASAPGEKTAPAIRERSTTKKPAKRVAATGKAKPSVSPVKQTSIEPAEAVSAPKKVPTRPDWAMADTRDAHTLQSEIADALARDPKLAGSAIRVDVDEMSVTLEGRAAGGEERLLAQRLAHSYAWNRKLVDHIEVVPAISAQKQP